MIKLRNPFYKETVDPTRDENRQLAVSSVDTELRMANAMFDQAVQSLEAVQESINMEKIAAQEQIKQHEEEIENEKITITRLDKRKTAAERVTKNIKKYFSLDLDELDEDVDSSENPAETPSE